MQEGGREGTLRLDNNGNVIGVIPMTKLRKCLRMCTERANVYPITAGIRELATSRIIRENLIISQLAKKIPAPSMKGVASLPCAQEPAN